MFYGDTVTKCKLYIIYYYQEELSMWKAERRGQKKKMKDAGGAEILGGVG